MRFQTGIFKHFGIILGKTVVNYIVIIDMEGMNGTAFYNRHRN